jgi:hypothetical protein
VWVVVRLPIPAVAVDKLPGSDDGDSDEPGDINDMRVSVSIGNATPMSMGCSRARRVGPCSPWTQSSCHRLRTYLDIGVQGGFPAWAQLVPRLAAQAAAACPAPGNQCKKRCTDWPANGRESCMMLIVTLYACSRSHSPPTLQDRPTLVRLDSGPCSEVTQMPGPAWSYLARSKPR